MKTIILINSIIELIGGICVIMYPELLLMGHSMDNTELNLSKMYGIAASGFGFTSYLMYRYAEKEELIKYFTLLVIAFHLILSFHLSGMMKVGVLDHSGPFYFHLATTIIFIILYLRKIK